MLRIISKKDGFRRCGVAHSDSPKDYPDDFFTPEQIEALKAEPMLVVLELADDDAIIAQVPDLEDMGIEKLKALCDRLTIEYPAKAKKNDLIALIEANTAEPPKE